MDDPTPAEGNETGSEQSASLPGADGPPDQHEAGLRTVQADVAELRRRLDLRGEEIDALQIAAARRERRWHKDPTVLTAVLAVTISVITTLLSQYNLTSDREIQLRSRLTTALQDMAGAQQMLAKEPGASVDNLVLLAGDAAQLLESTESSAFEKLEVAQALLATNQLGKARELAITATQQSDGQLEVQFAERIIAQVAFQTGDVTEGRGAYQRVLAALQQPTPDLDSPALRRYLSALVEFAWAKSEIDLTGDCAAARGHQDNAKASFAALRLAPFPPQQQVIDSVDQKIASLCPAP